MGRAFVGRRALGAAVLAGAVALAPASARAALTSGEQGQIASYVAEGNVATADRVRSLVARPDLTIDESAAALTRSLAPLVFSDGRAAYVHELLYGPSSLPSRSVLAVAVTRALAARADAVLARRDADLDRDPAALAELGRIFAFVDTDVSNAGAPHGAAHDTSAGIGASSYDDAGRALAALVTGHARWLKGDAQVPAAVEPLRAQLQLAVLDMANDTTSRRFDVAGVLGLAGSRRSSLTELGVLVLDDGTADAQRIDRVRALLARMPSAREPVEAIAFFDAGGALRSRGDVIAAARPVASSRSPFGDDVTAPAFDAEILPLSSALAGVATRRALEARPDLRAQADKDVAAAGGDVSKVLGFPASTSTAGAIAAAVQLLILDGPTAVDLALAGIPGERPERAAILSDALGVLATFPASGGAGTLMLGHEGDANGTIAMTNVRTAQAGFVTGFTLGGHSFALTRDDAGHLGARRDGAPVTLAMLEGVRTPVSSGELWSSGGIVFAKLAGAPRAGVAPGGRVRLVASGPSGVDAIATAGPGDDAVVDGTFQVTGESAIVLRASATPSGFKGVALVLDANAKPTKASIRAWDDLGHLTELVAPIDLVPASSYAVHVAAKGAKLEARVGPTTLRADVPAGLAHGDVALAVKRGCAVEARGWSVKPGR